MAGDGLELDTPRPGVLRLRLDRPARRNALDAPLVDALHDALDGLDARAVVLGSTDSSIFCGGADLDLDDVERAAVSVRLYELYGRMSACDAPFIAAVGGAAVGGGAQLAVACDIRIAGPRARLRFPGPGHGLAVGAWALPSLVGRGRAMELCLSMRWVDAEEASRIGLVDRVAEDPDAAALDLAEHVAALDPDAVARVKRVVGTAVRRDDALAEEAEGNRLGWSGNVAGLLRERSRGG
jgi:enoyl-CoA hydratase/carnithine racemase